MMSRTPMMTGNWKMNTHRADAIALAKGVAQRAAATPAVETVLCPPFPYLYDVKAAVEGTAVKVGAQNVYWEEKGAFTGEVSVTQVAEACDYVIIGHSERRQYFAETDETVNRRVQAALAHGLTPIMCVGETLQQREVGQTNDVLVRQVRGGLDGVQVPPHFVIAYEPVWAIGTGHAADGATAGRAVATIRDTVRSLAPGAADAVRILYGGSVTPDNFAEFMSHPDIDGGLVGGASLKVDSFAALIEAAARS
jgi:triosephosphate isomerase